jgi:tetratricopeptide (TPR) repeat protein
LFIQKDIDLSKKDIEKLLNEKLKNLKTLEKIAKGSEYIRELSDIAFLQFELNNFEESEKNFLISLKHFKKQQDRLGQAAVYGILGTLYYKTEDYDKAIESYNNAYNIYKELNQTTEKITCLKGIGNSLLKLKKLDEACDKFLECSAICSDNDDIYNLLDCLGNLSYIYEIQEQWDVVFELYKKSLEAFQQLNDKKGIIVSYFNMGILKKRFNEFGEALLFFKEGTNVAIDANYAEYILRGLSYVGETLFYQGKLNEAKDQLIKALRFAKKIDAKNAILQLKILLNSLGLDEQNIQDELNSFQAKEKNNDRDS